MSSGPPPHLDAEVLGDLVTMKSAIDAVGAALALVAAGELDQPPRLVLNEATSLVMAAVRRSTGETAVKTVSVHVGDGASDRRPGVAGLFTWLDPRPDGPAFTADGAQVTAIRTGAVSGLATRLLAEPSANHLGLLGSGRQAISQVAAVCAVRPIRTITVWSRTPDHAAHLVARLAGERPEIEVTRASTADQAVAGADVVCTATASTTPLFATASLSSRAHVNAVGAYRATMAELPTDLLLEAATVAVDDLDGCRQESGEVIAALAEGLPPARLSGLHELAEDPGTRTGRTVFKSVGCAALDFAIGDLVAGHVRHD